MKIIRELLYFVLRFCRTWLGLTLAAALIVLPAALALPQPAAAVCAPAVTVTSSLDDGSGGTLREAIAGVCSGGTITFDSSLSGTTITITSTLDISQDVTIDGSGLAVDIAINGDDQYRVFSIGSGLTVALKHLKIEHGYTAGEDGAGILALDGSLSVTDSSFMNNEAGVRGAGIDSEGSLTISRTTFTDNQSGQYGGGVYQEGGSLTITDSLFQGNSSNSGGGIWVLNASLTVTRGTFVENSSTYYGGAIFYVVYDQEVSASLTVQDSTFDSNNAGWSGGAIDLERGTGTITGSTFIGNGNLDANGGGVANAGTLTVADSTFTGNSGWLGGGISNCGTPGIPNILNLWNSTFSGNSASTNPNGDGAAVYNDGVLHFGNNILANSTQGADCINSVTWAGQILTNTNNLVEDGTCNSLNGGSPANFLSGDPALDSLKDNGGPTQTMALLPGSIALDAGDYTICMNAPVNGKDQRGQDRSAAALECDRGAFEYAPPAAFAKSAPGNSATRQGLSLTLVWTAASPVTSYEYCYATDSGCTDWINAGDATQVNINGLDYSTTYYWQVRAWNDSDGPTDADSGTYWQFTTRDENTYLYLPIIMR